MLWQEASEKSPYKVATRVSKDGTVMRRDSSGTAIIYGKDGYVREVKSHEVEGFLDWEPMV